jgi:hypothetical protein
VEGSAEFTTSASAARTSPRFGCSSESSTRDALALFTIAASGWLISCAMKAPSRRGSALM